MCHRYHTLHWPAAHLQLHVKDLHWVVMNNSLVMFEKVPPLPGPHNITYVRKRFTEELIYLGILRTEI